jgi:L-fuculose-phosphate aldolase
MKQLRLRRQIIEAARRMNELGLNQGTAGNVSARTPEGFLITPSGLAYEEMRPSDIVAMSFDGSAEGKLPPSTEWRIHRDVLSGRADVNAVIHAHATFATTLSCLRRGIPAFHYMVAVAGGPSIRCAPYATFGTEELSRATLAALEDRTACLLANHGLIAVGETLDQALSLAVEVETLAEQYWRALQIGEPAILSDAEMDVVIEKFRTYGCRPDPPPPRRTR